MTTGTLILITTILLLAYGVLIYNRLISLKNRFENAFSQVDVQLQRRYELIPNLVETARAYMKHESETLQAVTDARNTASRACSEAARQPDDASAVGALASAEGSLMSAMGRFNVVMEAYPELKADQSMQDLHESLATTENRVAFSRQAYSDSVMNYNTAREQFPAVIIASICSFKEADLFEVSEPEMKQAVKVSFA